MALATASHFKTCGPPMQLYHPIDRTAPRLRAAGWYRTLLAIWLIFSCSFTNTLHPSLEESCAVGWSEERAGWRARPQLFVLCGAWHGRGERVRALAVMLHDDDDDGRRCSD